MLLNCQNLSLTATATMVGRANTLCLNKAWMKVSRSHVFARLLRMTQESNGLQKQWKGELLRAAELIGKGINSYDMATAFTWNMVAMEVLLCRRNDTYSKEIPRRVEALLGWVAEVGEVLPATEARGRLTSFVAESFTKAITMRLRKQMWSLLTSFFSTY